MSPHFRTSSSSCSTHAYHFAHTTKVRLIVSADQRTHSVSMESGPIMHATTSSGCSETTQVIRSAWGARAEEQTGFSRPQSSLLPPPDDVSG
mmetsp:Transcript_8558/g.35244  ORF Transcript_8558/g.35244 Transcript_8558/m.35244 type:complete len:92 (-) Transcript_8558:145-420(-)